MRFHRYAALMVAALLVAGCSLAAPEPAAPQQVGGGISPETVTLDFFGDLGSALQDPDLESESRRDYWVDRLASYFAPNERPAQRIALRESLGSFAGDLDKLGEGETLTLELRGFTVVRKLSEEGDRATVELPEAVIYMLITREADGGPVPIYEQPIAFSQVIGTTRNTVPLVRIGGRWYLTEG